MASCPVCRRDVQDLELTRSLLSDLPAPVSRRSFRLHPADAGVAPRAWRPAPGWAVRLVPALPALRAVTAGVALLLLAVTAGDVLTRPDDIVQSPRADIGGQIAVATSADPAETDAAVALAPTTIPEPPTPTAMSIFAAAEVPTPGAGAASDGGAGEVADEANAASAGESADGAGPETRDAASGREAQTETIGSDRTSGDDAGGDRAAGRSDAGDAVEPAVAETSTGEDRDEETADDAAAGASAPRESEANAPSARSLAPTATPGGGGENAPPTDPADIAISQTAPEPETPDPPTSPALPGTDEAASPVAIATTAEPGSPTASPAEPPAPATDTGDRVAGDRSRFRLAQVALGLVLAAMLGLLGIVRRWEQTSRG